MTATKTSQSANRTLDVGIAAASLVGSAYVIYLAVQATSPEAASRAGEWAGLGRILAVMFGGTAVLVLASSILVLGKCRVGYLLLGLSLLLMVGALSLFGKFPLALPLLVGACCMFSRFHSKR